MKTKQFLSIVFVCLFLFLFTGFSFADPKTPKSPNAFFPQKNYVFDPVVDGNQITHDFVLQNKGGETLLIKKVSTD